MSIGMEVGLGAGDFVLDGDPAPRKKGTAPTKFSAHVYCGQTAGWIKMRLDMEVDLGPSDVVLDGVAALPTRATAPSFRPMARWIETPLGMEVVVGPGHIVLEDGSPTIGAQPPPPLFGRCLLWPRSPSQLLLSSCYILKVTF